MRWRALVAGFTGVTLTLLGIGVVLVPGMVTGLPGIDQLVRGVGERDPTVAAVAMTVLVVLSVAVTARSSGPSQQTADEDRFDQLLSRPPEAVSADRHAVAGEGGERAGAGGVTVGGESLGECRDRLRALAVEACVETEEWTRAEARRAVDRGSWTDDVLAAAFLAGADGPTSTVGARLRLWLAPSRERRRRIDRTLSVIEARYR
jgi:hypothetical protein